jgi:hypothetical protein
MKQPKKGSVSETTLDDFLAEQGLLEACEAQAIVLDSHLDPDGFQFVNRKFR